MRLRHLVGVFTDMGTSVDAAHSIARGERYETEDKKQLDAIAFAGTLLALISYLVWFVATLLG